MRERLGRLSGIGALAATLTLLAACATPAANGRDPLNPCFDDVIMVGMNQLTCSHALELANARLGVLHWPVTRVDYTASVCGGKDRCAEPAVGDANLVVLPIDEAWIIFTFWAGEPLLIHVGPTEIMGVFEADAPEPAPDWLVDHLADMAEMGPR